MKFTPEILKVINPYVRAAGHKDKEKMSKKILFISDTSSNPVKFYLNQTHKLAKGFIRIGHDARIFSYSGTLRELSFSKSRTVSKLIYKTAVDRSLAEMLKSYCPDIIFISFPKFFDTNTISLIRQTTPGAVLIGNDGDPWPERQCRIEAGKELDIIVATNDGNWLQKYRSAGVPLCAFLPNYCDPDTDHRYEVEEKWKTDILWTGTIRHRAHSGQLLREEIVTKLSTMPNAKLYGCMGNPQIGGIDYLYAISGARTGIHINAENDVQKYHSDRLTHYLACGTCVLAKRVPGSENMFKDGVHLRYFDNREQLNELIKYYLGNEQQRKKIADAGMAWVHEQFNCEKIAGYILELVRSGRYSAPWFAGSSTADAGD